MTERYRPDIDGQRAIAILAVLLVHLQVRGFSGGFVGVDVFFVISGYLITRLVHDEVMATGRFQFGRFYMRRLRRLYPAMLVTFLATFIAGAILFPPFLLSELAASLIAAVLSVSNIFFSTRLGYFDVATWLEPLVHTWSLGIEEQFYLVWPALLVALIGSHRRKLLPLAGLALITVGSLLANPLFASDPGAIFFLLPFRAFELGIGGLMVWVVRIDAPGFVHELVACLGYALIAWAIVSLDSLTVFPSFNALPPCIGSACLIYSGRARFAGIALRNPVSVALGRISYSLYLVHWPIIMFARYTIAYRLTPEMKLACVAVAVAAAILLHLAIEQRLRYEPKSGGTSRPAFAAACAIAALALIVPAFTAWRTGWLFRYPTEFAPQLRVAAKADYVHYVNSNFGRLVEPFADNGKLKVLVIGDSNGGDFLNIVAEAGLLDSVDLRTQAVLHMCQPVLSEDPLMFQTRAPPGLQSCEANLAPVKRDPRLRAADVVILAGMWPVWAVKRLPETIDYLRKHSHARIAVFGTKGVSQDGVTYLARNARASDLLTRSYSIEPTIATRNGMLAVEARNARVEFYDPTELLCRPKCPFLTPDGHLVMWDTFHLTKAGARMLAQRLRAEWAHQLFRPVGAMR